MRRYRLEALPGCTDLHGSSRWSTPSAPDSPWPPLPAESASLVFAYETNAEVFQPVEINSSDKRHIRHSGIYYVTWSRIEVPATASLEGSSSTLGTSSTCISSLDIGQLSCDTQTWNADILAALSPSLEHLGCSSRYMKHPGCKDLRLYFTIPLLIWS